MARTGPAYDVPATYARLIEPRYAPIADLLVDAARLSPDDDVLELGAGTGLVTRRVAPAVRSLVATDLSAPMLDHARRGLDRHAHVGFQLLDYGAAYPFLDDSFSLVLSGLTFVQASSRALREVGRVLRPGGRLAVVMWGPTYGERRLLSGVLESLGGGRFPGAAPGAAVRRIERAGFRAVRRRDVALTARFASPDEYVAYRRGFGRPLVWTPGFYERFLAALGREARRTQAADGSLEIGWVVTVITARAPAAASRTAG